MWLRYSIILFLFAGSLTAQSLTVKNEYKAEKAGALAEVNVLKNPDDGKIYIVTREAMNGQLYLVLYDRNFNRLTTLLSTPKLDVDYSFIRNGNLYFADDKLKYISLSDYKEAFVNSDRKGIISYLQQKLNGRDVIVSCDNKNYYIYDLQTNKELINIKKDNSEKNKSRAIIYNSEMYYTSEANEITKFDLKNRQIAWRVKLPDKPVKLIGIRISSMINAITSINPFRKNGRDLIGVFTSSGDYFCFDPASGKLVKDDIQFEKFDDLSQNNSKLFVNSFYFEDKAKNNLLIYAGSPDHSVYCINEKDFSTIWETDTDNEIQLPLSYCDINKDGYPEVFGVTDYDNNLFILDGKTGKTIISKSLKEGKIFNQTKIFLADLYGTGALNLIVKVNKEKIRVFELSDVQVPKNYVLSFQTITE